MDNFNKTLLQGVETDDIKVAELLLFMIERNINPHAFFKEDMLDKVNTVTNVLHVKGAIEPSYTEGGAFRVTQPLFEVESVGNEFIKKLRDMFSVKNIGISGKAGTNKEVETVFGEWRKQFPLYTESQILTATKNYISHWLKRGEPQFIRKISNFILTTDESYLSTWIEDDTLVVDNWRNKVT